MWMLIAGGVPMVFVVVFGLVAVAAGARFAYAPADGRWGHVGALCAAVGAAAIAGCAADLMAVATNVSGNDEWARSPDFQVIVLAGMGESMSPIVLGFALVAAAACLVAVGLRRAPAALS